MSVSAGTIMARSRDNSGAGSGPMWSGRETEAVMLPLFANPAGFWALLGVPASASAAPLGPAPAAATLQLVVPIVADDAGLAQFARSVSTPGSPQYGQYEPIPMVAQEA